MIGFDVNSERIRELKAGKDRTREIDAGDLNHRTLSFTSDPLHLKAADFFIVTVPTPIKSAGPDGALESLNDSGTGAEFRRHCRL